MDQGTAGFEEFYEEWFPKVYNYARFRTASPTRADEIVSETFTRALKSWGNFDPNKGERRTWLFSIAFRCVADHYRSEKRRGWFGLDSTPEPAEPAPAEYSDLEAALKALSEAHREIVTLKFFSGMTNRAIAVIMGLTDSNVAVILFRSIRTMRKSLSTEAYHG